MTRSKSWAQGTVDFKHFATLMIPMMPEEDGALLNADTIADGRRFADADSLDAMILRCASMHNRARTSFVERVFNLWQSHERFRVKRPILAGRLGTKRWSTA